MHKRQMEVWKSKLGISDYGVAWIAFLPPILIGAFGHIEFSDLDRAGSDNILPLQVIYSGGEWFGGLVLIAGLAALMSTMDSQLLATGSLVTRDLLQINENKGKSKKTNENL